MRKIFISYRRDDTRPHALAIYNELAEQFHPDSLFFDLHKIAAGKDFRQVIQESLEESGVVLVLIGPRWLTLTDNSGLRRLDHPEDWVRKEIEQALFHHHSDPSRRLCNIIPVLIDNTLMPQASSLPKSIEALAPKQALPVRFDRDFGRDMERLLQEIRKYIGGEQQDLRCPKCRQVDNVKKLSFVAGALPQPEPPIEALMIAPEEPVEPIWDEQANERSVKHDTPGCVVAFFRSVIGLGFFFWTGFVPLVILFWAFLYGIPRWTGVFILGSIIVALIVLDLIRVSISRSKLRARNRARFEAFSREHQERQQIYDANMVRHQKDVEDQEQAYQLWQQRKPLWDQLFYCQRDGSCFLPGHPKVDQDPIALIDALPGAA